MISYGIRFTWDNFFSLLLYDRGTAEPEELDMFNYFVCFDLVTLFDGLSFFVLLYFHRRNFVTSKVRQSASVSSLSSKSRDRMRNIEILATSELVLEDGSS